MATDNDENEQNKDTTTAAAAGTATAVLTDIITTAAFQTKTHNDNDDEVEAEVISTRASTPQTSLCSPTPVSNTVNLEELHQQSVDAVTAALNIGGVQQQNKDGRNDKNGEENNDEGSNNNNKCNTDERRSKPLELVPPQITDYTDCTSSVEVSLTSMAHSPPRHLNHHPTHSEKMTTTRGTVSESSSQHTTTANANEPALITTTPTPSFGNVNSFQWEDENQHDTPTASGVKSCASISTSKKTKTPSKVGVIGNSDRLPYLVPPNYTRDNTTNTGMRNSIPANDSTSSITTKTYNTSNAANNNKSSFHGGSYRNSSFYSTAGFSLTSSTRSVKSTGSSIVDTDIEQDPFLDHGGMNGVIPEEVISVWGEGKHLKQQQQHQQQQPGVHNVQQGGNGEEQYYQLMQMLTKRDSAMTKSLDELKNITTMRFREMAESNRKEVDRGACVYHKKIVLLE